MRNRTKAKLRAETDKQYKKKAAEATMNVNPENRRIFESARDHLNDASLKNSEALDKAILTLSSSGLALSLTFTKFVAPIGAAKAVCLLHISWLCFGGAIISTIVSFLSSTSAIAVEREHIYKYYIKENDKYANEKNIWGRFTYWLNRISAMLFIVGMLSTVGYVWSNTQQEQVMSKKENERGYVPPKREPSSSGQSSKPQSSQEPKNSGTKK